MPRIKGKACTDKQQLGTVIGIDASKASLDVCLHPSRDRFRVRNDAVGFEELRDRCLASSADLVAMEAEGRCHRGAYAYRHDAGIPVAVSNPYRHSRFAETLSRLAKKGRDRRSGRGGVCRRHRASTDGATNRNDGAHYRDHRRPAAGSR